MQMSSFKNEIVSFSQFCKEQQFFISIDKLQTYFGYIESKKIQSFEEKIRYLFFLIPKDKDEKDKLKHLISEYFNFKFEESTSFEFNFFDEYDLNENFQDVLINNESRDIDFSKIAIEIIQDFENLDFSRPVSNAYWLNQLKKTKAYEDILSLFDVQFEDSFKNIINNLNRENFSNFLDLKLLELLKEERNKTRDAYQPSELDNKDQLNELDYLYTNSEERKKLLEQTYALGNKLAIKFKKQIKFSNKGNLNLRKTIRKSIQSGGVLQNIIYKPRNKKKPKLVILCDISGSMALYSLFGLTLLYGMVSRFNSIKSFVFIDGITEVTKDIKKLKKTEIESFLKNWNNFVKQDGHSDYSRTFEELVDEVKKNNANYKCLIVIGDARNNYRDIDEELVNEVGKSFKNIYWLNPERLKYWNTGDSLIRKFDRVTNNTSEVRNYNQMKAFVNSIDFKRDLK